MADEKPTAYAVAGPPVPKDTPCSVCGRVWADGKHYVRAPKGIKCAAGGCTADVFERCFGEDGAVVATRCIEGGHRLVFSVTARGPQTS